MTNKNGRAALRRTTLTTSRELDFLGVDELTRQTGHPKERWPLLVLDELVDNAIDACEDCDITPKIVVDVQKDAITITDNGPGIPADTVAGVLDFTVRVSSREHYVSPTRGAQGNALKTIVAMPFALDGNAGRVEIEAHGIRHDIEVKLDRIKQEPRIKHDQQRSRRFVKKGTRIKVHWPNSASSVLTTNKSQFLQIAEDFTFLNPHLTLTVDCLGERRVVTRTAAKWPKWGPSNPTSALWYTLDRFERLIAGYIGADEEKGQDRTVREVIAEFHGLTGTAKQKTILGETGLSRMNLSGLRNGDGLDHDKVKTLLETMKAHSKPIKPRALGIIGREHLAERFEALGCEMETFTYRKVEGERDGVPWIVETAFAATTAALDLSADAGPRRIVTGVNWSPAISSNPFRLLGHASLDSILEEQRAGHKEPIVFLLHLACPRVNYTDHGKSALVIGDAQAADDEEEIFS